MKMLILLFTITFQIFFGSIAHAQATSLMRPLTSQVFVFSPTKAPLGYSGTNVSGANSWDLYQYNNSATLLPVSGGATGWATSTASSRLQYYGNLNSRSNANVYELAQANPSNTCGLEFDLFLQNDLRNGFHSSATLTGLGSIMMSIELGIPYIATQPICSGQSEPKPDYSQ